MSNIYLLCSLYCGLNYSFECIYIHVFMLALYQIFSTCSWHVTHTHTHGIILVYLHILYDSLCMLKSLNQLFCVCPIDLVILWYLFKRIDTYAYTCTHFSNNHFSLPLHCLCFQRTTMANLVYYSCCVTHANFKNINIVMRVRCCHCFC